MTYLPCVFSGLSYLSCAVVELNACPGATEIYLGEVKSQTSMPNQASQLIYYVSPCFT